MLYPAGLPVSETVRGEQVLPTSIDEASSLLYDAVTVAR